MEIQQTNTSKIFPALQKEVLGQLNKLSDILMQIEQIERIPDLTNIDLIKPENVRKWKDIVAGETKKVTSLRLLIAFVGTMNAGKSMTLNAIVGARILPSRNTPMTSLPTLITHNPDIDEPVMNLPNPEPFNEAINKIKKTKFNKARMSDDIAKSYDALSAVNLIDSKYIGENAIHETLAMLNDIARISKYLGIDSPLAHYTDFEELPHIELRFASLTSSITGDMGTLTLIDSPGPDKADLSDLGFIVTNILEKASAVTCVIDFTQLKSTAEADIKDSVISVQDLARSKLSVLINKFDQKTGDSLNAYEAKTYVETELFPEREIEGMKLSVTGRIFPISAFFAFLSNRVRRLLDSDGKLPQSIDNSNLWLRDFGQVAYGVFYEDHLENADVEYHLRACEGLWKKSLMDPPLNKIIEMSYRNAAPEALRGATEKTQHITKQLKDNIGIFEVAISTEIETLDSALARLDERIDTIEKTLKHIEALNQSTIIEVNLESAKLLNKWTRESQRQIDAWNRKQEKSSQKSLLSVKTWIESFLHSLEGSEAESQSIKKFESEAEAQAYLNLIFDKFRSSAKTQISHNIASVQTLVHNAQSKIENELKEKVYPILAEEQSDIQDTFDLTIDIPLPKFDRLEVSINAIEKQLIKPTTVTVTESFTTRERKWWTLWLFKVDVKHSTSKEVEQYTVDPSQVKVELENSMDYIIELMQKSITEYITVELAKILSHFFSEVRSKLSDVHKSISSGRSVQNKNIAVKERVLKDLKPILSSINFVLRRTEDSLGVLDDIKLST